ncbi:MAG: molybdopterin-guanine dinucleotide biosynthesis protein B [Gammaproteobacteria bacterium]
MQNAQKPILGFAAASGTGKTTLLAQLIPLLKQQGLRVGLIKHSHHSFDIDHPGKDSHRLRMAGASPVMLVSKYRYAIMHEFETPQEPSLNRQLAVFDQSGIDLILVEGFKAEKFPKIELHRPSLQRPLLFPNDPNIIAIASDAPVEAPNPLVKLDLNRADLIARFILDHYREFK